MYKIVPNGWDFLQVVLSRIFINFKVVSLKQATAKYLFKSYIFSLINQDWHIYTYFEFVYLFISKYDEECVLIVISFMFYYFTYKCQVFIRTFFLISIFDIDYFIILVDGNWSRFLFVCQQSMMCTN